MNINLILWIFKGLVAVLFLMAGIMKATQPKEKLAENMAWVTDFSPGQIRTIGVLEILGAIGLVLPENGHPDLVDSPGGRWPGLDDDRRDGDPPAAKRKQQDRHQPGAAAPGRVRSLRPLFYRLKKPYSSTGSKGEFRPETSTPPPSPSLKVGIFYSTWIASQKG